MRVLGHWHPVGKAIGFGLLATAMCTAGVVIGGSPTGAAASGTPLVVGVMEAQTGTAGCPSCHDVGATDTMQAWEKTVNAHGGIDGHPVTLIVLDTANDPGTAQSDLATLQAHNALAIVGPDSVSTEPTWKTTIDKDKLPVIGGQDYTTAPATDPLWYSGSSFVAANNWGTVFSSTKGHLTSKPKLGILLCNTVSVCTTGAKALASAAKSQTIPVVYNDSTNSHATTYTPQCLAMKSSGATAVAAEGVIYASLATDCARQGYHPLFLTQTLVASPQQVKSQPQLSGLVGSTPMFVPWEGFQQEKPYFTMLKKYAPALLPGGTQYSEANEIIPSIAAYVAARIFEKGIQNANVPASTTVTRTDLIRGLSMFHGTTLGGISPPITYATGAKPNPLNLCFYLYKQTKNTSSTYIPIPENKMTYYCEPQKDL